MLARDLGARRAVAGWYTRAILPKRKAVLCGLVDTSIHSPWRTCVSATWSAMNRRQNSWALSTALMPAPLPEHLLPCCFAAQRQKPSTNAARRPRPKTIPSLPTKTTTRPIRRNLRTFAIRRRLSACASWRDPPTWTKGRNSSPRAIRAGALTEFLRALEIDPSNELAHQDIQRARDKLAPVNAQSGNLDSREQGNGSSTEVGSPVQLKPISNEPITLHMTEDSKVVYSTVGKAAGINVLFDPGVHLQAHPGRYCERISVGRFAHCGHSLGTFWHPVTANTIFVAMNTRAKRQELEEEAVQTFYLANTCAAKRSERYSDRIAQPAGERQALRRPQPERHRDAGHAGRAAAGAKAHQ